MPEIDYDDDDNVPSCGSIDGMFDDLLTPSRRNHGCTHFHTCDPPGPHLPHSHTCVHVHTQDPANDDSECRRKGGNNREAVRKYRLKRKAYTVSLADELLKLRALNQQLMLKLQNRVTLETELARLKCLLVDIRGRVEGEIGSFPYQNNSVKRLNQHYHMHHNNNNIVVDTNLPGSSNNNNNNNVPCNAQFGVTSVDGVALTGHDCSACGFHDLDCMGFYHNLQAQIAKCT
ncbi:hypothetical protein vseg_012828 [Gypsophila vaccaria]